MVALVDLMMDLRLPNQSLVIRTLIQPMAARLMIP